MYVRIHEQKDRPVVAACDVNLIGRILESKNGAYMDLDNHRGFYIGTKTTATKLKEALKNFSSANLVGKKTIKVAMSLGLVAKEDLMYIGEIPYVQIYSI